MRYVTEKRCEPRMLCSDLVRVEWKSSEGRTRHAFANLEDISPSGACLQMPGGVPKGARIRMIAPEKVLKGETAWCRRRDWGYYIGVRFCAGSRWIRKQFAPRHLLDPRVLAAQGIAAAGRKIAGL